MSHSHSGMELMAYLYIPLPSSQDCFKFILEDIPVESKPLCPILSLSVLEKLLPARVYRQVLIVFELDITEAVMRGLIFESL